ncbi:MAG: type VI secretion system protein TssA [[Eubacterium] sulci]|jgi:type VI secretion-associated protein, VC_A0119 family|nr:type VI secretion system protein TssA [[Eubacterium] sulci]
MEVLIDNPWKEQILSPIQSEIDIDEDLEWLELDGDMVKLGSLEHQTLNISHLRHLAAQLLSTKSKDLRILAHFLRTLQHSGKVAELLIGLASFADYVEHYWETSPPSQKIRKERLTQQIFKRFENMASYFSQDSSRLEKDQAKQQFARLIEFWKDNVKLKAELEQLLQRYTFTDKQIHQNDNVSDSSGDEQPNSGKKIITESGHSTSDLRNISSEKEVIKPIVEPVSIDTSNDRAWKNTLLKVADYLIERDFSNPIGYQLRRFAIWSLITVAPLAENDRTQLAAVSQDRINDYKILIEKALSSDVWKEIEYSLTLAPYWIEGHYLSAKVAERMSCPQVAKEIKESVLSFIERLPELKQLKFNDGTPFISDECSSWLYDNNEINQALVSDIQLNEQIGDYYKEQGILNTLKFINDQSYTDLRSQIYAQLSSIELLEKEGLHNLAKQQYFTLEQAISPIMVKDWEPSLFTLLHNKQEKNA